MIKLSLVWRPGTNPLHHSLMIYFASPWICPCWSPNVFQGSWFGPCSPCVIKKKKKSALNKWGWVQGMAGHGWVGVMLNTFLLLDGVARRHPEVELSPTAWCRRLENEAESSLAAPGQMLLIFTHLGRNPSQQSCVWGGCWGGHEGGEEEGKLNPSIAVAAGQSRFHLGHWERPVWLFKAPSGWIQTLGFPDSLHGLQQGCVQCTDLPSRVSFFIPHPLIWIMSSCQGINLGLVHLNIFDFGFSSLLILQLCL